MCCSEKYKYMITLEMERKKERKKGRKTPEAKEKMKISCLGWDVHVSPINVIKTSKATCYVIDVLLIASLIDITVKLHAFYCSNDMEDHLISVHIHDDLTN